MLILCLRDEASAPGTETWRIKSPPEVFHLLKWDIMRPMRRQETGTVHFHKMPHKYY
jgi:hypothetical protein